ncbi:MAG: hypothetical protein HUU38_06310, partial [Anaerolineales bacterium]|nr:hypothetical protein [Anaerolineales bacterium]
MQARRKRRFMFRWMVGMVVTTGIIVIGPDLGLFPENEITTETRTLIAANFPPELVNPLNDYLTALDVATLRPPSPTASASPLPTTTGTALPTDTATLTPTDTARPTGSPTSSPTPSSTVTPTASPTLPATATNTSVPSATPTLTATLLPLFTPT